MSGGNLVLANVYGRTPAGQMRPLRAAEDGTLATTPAPVLVTDWAADLEVSVLTPLVAFTPFADDSHAVIIGMRVAATSVDGATFLIDASEDGVTPALSSHVEFVLTAGQHDLWVTQMPLLIRYLRLTVQPTGAGPAKVAFSVRRLPR